EEDLSIDYQEFRTAMENVRTEALRLMKEDKVKIASHSYGDIDAVIEHGLMNVGMYHVRRPLLKNKNGDIVTEDLNTLYYYHNRLDGYGLKVCIYPHRRAHGCGKLWHCCDKYFGRKSPRIAV